METTGCYSQYLTDWINLFHSEVGVTIENVRNIHAFIQSLNLPHKTDKLDAQAIARFSTERDPKATLTTQIEKIDREIKVCIVQDEELLSEVHIITMMPGVNLISAYNILTKIGSLRQYSAKELSSLAGLAPRIVESGSSIHSSYLS